MNLTGARLAHVQVKGHLAIDAIYQDLAEQVEVEVLNQASTDDTGEPRLSLRERLAILVAVALLLDRARLPLMEAVLEVRRSAIAAAAISADPPPVDPGEDLLARDEVYRTLGTDRSSVVDQLGAILLAGIGGKVAVSEIARRARQYFSPFFAPRRNAAGVMTRAGRQGVITQWPGRAGMASQHPRLVMLYQTAEAHDATIRRQAARDDAFVRWNLSGRHPKTDVCDTYASRDSGYGPGVYRASDAPKRPHPRCRCYLSYVVVTQKRGMAA